MNIKIKKYMEGKMKLCVTVHSETVSILGYSLLVFSLYMSMYTDDMIEVITAHAFSILCFPLSLIMRISILLSILWKHHFDGCIFFPRMDLQ